MGYWIRNPYAEKGGFSMSDKDVIWNGNVGKYMVKIGDNYFWNEARDVTYVPDSEIIQKTSKKELKEFAKDTGASALGGIVSAIVLGAFGISQ